MMSRLLSCIALLLLLVGILVVYGQDDTANLRILMDKESFTVAVIATAPVSVSGLQFAYTDSSDIEHVWRWGSWGNFMDGVRDAFRNWSKSSFYSDILGFRCARDYGD